MLAAGLATVKVNEPGEWRPFAIGQLVASLDTGGPSYWRAMPEVLRATALDYFYLTVDSAKTRAEDYGKLDFAVVSDGPVWMLTTARFFNSGNAAGNWQPEVITQAKLEADGWRVIARDLQSEYGYEPPGENKSLLGWLLFERTCKAGQQFSIRTEKYQSPVILRTRAGLTEDAPGLRLRMVKSGVSRMQLEAKGDPGAYVLQSSSDLRSWVDVNEARLTSANYETISSVNSAPTVRFFRLRKSSPPSPPPSVTASVIVTHPATFSVKEGQRFALSVVATGSGQLSYQWFLNGKPISGATASSYSASATLDSAGSYTVTVSAGSANVTSRPGVLTVIPDLPEFAPVSLFGRTIRLNSPVVGSFLFISSPTEAKYVIFPDSGLNGTKGTFTFAKSGPNEASIAIDDYRYAQKSGSAIFTSANAGSGFLGEFGGAFVIEETVAAGVSLAPTTLAGKTISVAIIDGDGFVLSDAGGYTVTVQSNGTSYLLTETGIAGASIGALSYRRLSATTSSLTATDSVFESVTGTVTWYSAKRGEMSLSRPDGAWQNSVVQLE